MQVFKTFELCLPGRKDGVYKKAIFLTLIAESGKWRFLFLSMLELSMPELTILGLCSCRNIKIPLH